MKKHEKHVHLKGDYKLWIVDANFDTRGRYIEIEFRIVGPDRRLIGTRLRQTFSVRQPSAMLKLRELLEACGMYVPDGFVTLNLAQFPRLECMGRVENGEALDFCSVTEFYERLRERDRRFERAVKQRAVVGKRSDDCFVIPIPDERRTVSSKYVM